MIEGVTLGERYQVFGRIGGSSYVIRYDGVDVLLARPVDIVALTTEAASDLDLRDQFEAFGRAAATRSHPHIIDVYDLGTFEGRPFIVTEHLTGEPLRAIIEEEAPFHPDDSVALIQQLAAPADNEATRAAGGGMVSVDTVVVDAAGVAKHSDLLTFGERYAAAQDEWAGKTHVPLPVGPVPALASIAYELLTGRNPEDGPRSPRPSTFNAAVTPDIDRIVMRGLDPRLRDFPSATAFANALTAAARRARDVRAPAQQTASHAQAPAIKEREPLLSASEAKTLVAPTPAAPAATRSGPARAPVLVDGMERHPRVPRRSIPWTWLAIAVLAALVLVLGIARFRDENGPATSNTRPTEENAANDVPISVQDPTKAVANAVPDVTGMSRDIAADELAKAGLIMQEETPVASDTVPAGAIAAQQPTAGAAIPGDRVVHVTLSRGPEAIDVAALGLDGQDASTAKQVLASKGFAVQTREAGSESVPAGRVISIDPSGIVAPNTALTLVVSVGDKVQIPRGIFSMPLRDAETKLAEAGIDLAGAIAVGPAAIQGRIDTAKYEIVSGDVIGVQNQAGNASFGAWIPRGSAVTLVYYDTSG